MTALRSILWPSLAGAIFATVAALAVACHPGVPVAADPVADREPLRFQPLWKAEAGE